MKQVMSGMLEKLEKRALADKIEFGSGDVCAQCSNTFVGWGQCRKCGYKMDHPEQCRNCMNVAPGVCGPCVDRGAPACRCDWIWHSNGKYRMKQGTHYEAVEIETPFGPATDYHAIELCPTYWQDVVKTDVIRIETNTVRGGKRLSPGQYRRRVTYRVDPQDKHHLIVSPEYNKILKEDSDLA
jgi:hypothetical protein